MENIATVQAKIEAGITDKEYDALIKEEARKMMEWIDEQIYQQIIISARGKHKQ